MRKSSVLARRMQRNHASYRGRNDINIVPMLDVMVILTFFLIFTAVFSKTSVVEVNLPGPTVQAPPTTPTLELEVILRRNLGGRPAGGATDADTAAAGRDPVRGAARA